MKFLYTILIFLILLSSCENTSDVNPITNISSIDTSILYTDNYGNIIGGDTSDWCYRDCDSIFNCFRFLPVWPNPVIDTFNIRFDIGQNQVPVNIYYLNSAIDTIFLLRDTLQAGSYLAWRRKSDYGLNNTYRKFFIKANSFVYSGDVKF